MAATYVVTVQCAGQYELEITGELSIAYALWTEEEDFCVLCSAHPSAGHTLDCPLVQENLHGTYFADLPPASVGVC